MPAHNSISNLEKALAIGETLDIAAGDVEAVQLDANKIVPSTGTTLTLGGSDTLLVDVTPGGLAILQATEIKATTHLTLGNLVDIALGVTLATGTGDGAAAATMVGRYAQITTATQTTASGASTTLTLTAGSILETDLVLASVQTAGTGSPCITKITPADGSLVIVIQNIHASAAFNAALKVSVVALGPS